MDLRCRIKNKYNFILDRIMITLPEDFNPEISDNKLINAISTFNYNETDSQNQKLISLLNKKIFLLKPTNIDSNLLTNLQLSIQFIPKKPFQEKEPEPIKNYLITKQKKFNAMIPVISLKEMKQHLDYQNLKVRKSSCIEISNLNENKNNKKLAKICKKNKYNETNSFHQNIEDSKQYPKDQFSSHFITNEKKPDNLSKIPKNISMIISSNNDKEQNLTKIISNKFKKTFVAIPQLPIMIQSKSKNQFEQNVIFHPTYHSKFLRLPPKANTIRQSLKLKTFQSNKNSKICQSNLQMSYKENKPSLISSQKFPNKTQNKHESFISYITKFNDKNIHFKNLKNDQLKVKLNKLSSMTNSE